ncbi:hypothetical protein JW962_01880 [Candidatus Dojkabacteria bacterium]|nr:hypothetical protein [Candidatus Dojkabacteria bacterium]
MEPISSNLSLHTRAIITVCKTLNIPYSFVHKDGICLKVTIGKPYFFIHHHPAFDSVDISKICKDKDLSYSILTADCDPEFIPMWRAYLDPDVKDEHKMWVKFKNMDEIITDIEKYFKYPVIVKPNKGSLGLNVKKCENGEEIKSALGVIFEKTPDYDYLSVVQEFLDVASEYRVIVFRKKILLAYKKDISNATFEGNLSPLHWSNSKAVIVTDVNLIASFQPIVDYVFEKLSANYLAFDIALDKVGKLWLIELNSSPGFSHFATDNGEDLIENIYEYIFSELLRIKT